MSYHHPVQGRLRQIHHEQAHKEGRHQAAQEALAALAASPEVSPEPEAEIEIQDAPVEISSAWSRHDNKASLYAYALSQGLGVTETMTKSVLISFLSKMPPPASAPEAEAEPEAEVPPELQAEAEPEVEAVGDMPEPEIEAPSEEEPAANS